MGSGLTARGTVSDPGGPAGSGQMCWSTMLKTNCRQPSLMQLPWLSKAVPSQPAPVPPMKLQLLALQLHGLNGYSSHTKKPKHKDIYEQYTSFLATSQYCHEHLILSYLHILQKKRVYKSLQLWTTCRYVHIYHTTFSGCRGQMCRITEKSDCTSLFSNTTRVKRSEQENKSTITNFARIRTGQNKP